MIRSAGIVSIDPSNGWMGGYYYLEHLIKCVAFLPASDRVMLHDVWWIEKPKEDRFENVRNFLGKPIVVSPPSSLRARLLRRLRQIGKQTSGARDLFENHAIDVFFPQPPCENSGTPYVFWLPDFQHLRRPDLMSREMREWFEQSYAKHVHAASRIVLSSEDARKDFAVAFPNLIDRTHVVRFCSVPDAEWWKLDPVSIASKYDLPERFFIVCNQLTRHKNHITLVHALEILRKRGVTEVHMVCTGSIDDYRKEDYVGQVRKYAEQHGLAESVHILGLIPRADQIALLRRSIAVLQPSLFEGWSTVIEDAKALGKPVLATRLPVHYEQLGLLHPYYLGLDDPEEWANAMESAWKNLAVGPDDETEWRALARLEDAKLESGLAFVNALQSAVE